MNSQRNQPMRKGFRGPNMITVMLAGSAITAKVDVSALSKDGWKIHSGHAPVADVEVHSLKSQKIEGTDTFALKGKSGIFAASKGEFERFSADYLTDLGYTVTPPASKTAT